MAAIDEAVLTPWMDRWGLTPDGAIIVTPAAQLRPVRHGAELAMLKVSHEVEEKAGALLMRWWDGDGAARVLAAEDDALLLERAMGSRSLSQWAAQGRDDEATRILCRTVAHLHRSRDKPPPAGLASMETWFAELKPMARQRGGMLAQAQSATEALLTDQREMVVLHGDIHHDNVLDFGPRGWLAIDPKRLRGDRAFDYANLFCNPDVGDPTVEVAVRPERFARRLDIVIEESGLERRRLLMWILAWAGLSAAWFLGDGEDAAVDFRIGELALAALAA